MTTPINYPMPVSVVWVASTGSDYVLSFKQSEIYYQLQAGFTYFIQVTNHSQREITMFQFTGKSWSTRVQPGYSVPAGKTITIPSLPVIAGDLRFMRPSIIAGGAPEGRIEARLIPTPITTT